MIKDLFVYIIKSLKSRLTRSILTILSILIGIMAIYALMSFGQGLAKYVDDTFQQMGTDKLVLQPLGGFGVPGSTGSYISQDDFDFVKKISGVTEGTAFITRQAEVRQDIKVIGKWNFVMSMPSNTNEKRLLDELYSIKVYSGRELKPDDNGKAVLGYGYTQPLTIFTKPVKLGSTVYVNEVPFTVVGFYDDFGNPKDNGNVYMPMDNAKTLFQSDDKYDMAIFRAAKDVSATDLAAKIKEKLRKHKGEKEGQEDFFIQTFEQLLQTYSTIITVLNSILVIIALISVIVAAVNISNTMYTAVLERTREIGVMKAIGARNSFIMWMFFLESGIIGLIGGLIGIFFGYCLAKFGGAIAAGAGFGLLKPYFPLWLTIGCLVFSFAVGAAAGFFPARAASKHKPVDALRYE
jgi:putative ABC transport system permease protein